MIIDVLSELKMSMKHFIILKYIEHPWNIHKTSGPPNPGNERLLDLLEKHQVSSILDARVQWLGHMLTVNIGRQEHPP